MAVKSYLGDGIKSIQRGTVSLDGLGTATVTITSVNTARSILFTSGTGILRNGTAATDILSTRAVQGVLTSATQVSITSQAGGLSGTTNVTGTAAWQVVEYY